MYEYYHYNISLLYKNNKKRIYPTNKMIRPDPISIPSSTNS